MPSIFSFTHWQWKSGRCREDWRVLYFRPVCAIARRISFSLSLVGEQKWMASLAPVPNQSWGSAVFCSTLWICFSWRSASVDQRTLSSKWMLKSDRSSLLSYWHGISAAREKPSTPIIVQQPSPAPTYVCKVDPLAKGLRGGGSCFEW